MLNWRQSVPSDFVHLSCSKPFLETGQADLKGETDIFVLLLKEELRKISTVIKQLPSNCGG